MTISLFLLCLLCKGVDQFLKRMGALYEIVIYTASLSKYADPLLDKLDIHKVMPRRGRPD